MASKFKFPPRGTARSNEVRLSGSITIGASGAVSSSSSECSTVAKTASETGRYTVTFDRKYRNVRPGGVIVVGDTDAAFGATNGFLGGCRNVSGSAMDVQLTDAAGADANPASGYVVHWHATAQE